MGRLGALRVLELELKKLLAIILFLWAFPAGATTYYISYSSGSNSNNGTAKVTPWKSAPTMQSAAGCAGAPHAYSHSAGDIFIFKQGDSWPNACFDIVISAGGSLGSPDQYTYDPTWGTAGGTTGNTGQAVGVYEFTAGSASINGSDGFNRFIYDNGNNWITFNGLAFNGMHAAGTGAFGNDMGIDVQSSTNVILSNCYVHGWDHSGATSDDLLWFVGHDGGASANNVGVRLTGCVFDGTGASTSGSATWKIPLIDNNIIKNMSNAVLSGADASIHDNQIGPINVSFDAGGHANCIEPITFISGGISTNYIYNNLFFSCSQAALLAQGVGGAGSEVDYVWNNVGWVGSTVAPNIPASIFQFSSYQSGASSAIYAWNNTAIGGSTIPCFRTLNQGGPATFTVLQIFNNHCISDVGLISNSNPGSSQTLTPNVTMSVATATSDGYNSSQTYIYSPVSTGSPSCGGATNLTSTATGNFSTLASDTTYGGVRSINARPTVGAWDMGAYACASTPPAPSTNILIMIR